MGDYPATITFHVSNNTPKEYVDAVREGILYWNQAFEGEKIKAELGPEGVTAPDPRYNIIQWVENDGAGSAYADVLPDPLTGEALHAQIYMTSVFAISSVAKLRRTLRSLAEAKSDKKSNPRLGVGFMQSNSVCEYFDTEGFRSEMEHALVQLVNQADLTDEKILQLSQSYVRLVVAHEVGHVLGLRHNFAGNLYNQISRSKKQEWLTSFLTAAEPINLEGKVPMSSVMEYGTFRDDIIVGYLMKTAKIILPYDKLAMRWGYYDDQTINKQRIPFCTDDEESSKADCFIFDEGEDPLVGLVEDISEYFKILPGEILEIFVAAKAPRNTQDVKEVSEVVLSLKTLDFVTTKLPRALKWFDHSVVS